ncbi:hypothetical protein BCV70DRAFT_45941 [Testicularia cyperi]|uniref:Uncharacterized protein n=1 Tax=Testicularia cyperi TaxID=1882483 RepID=A0A317XI24_9BASI|nr:hypothetical protein BCV70DRAFT_45941 [Testicularia cyperi]
MIATTTRRKDEDLEAIASSSTAATRGKRKSSAKGKGKSTKRSKKTAEPAQPSGQTGRPRFRLPREEDPGPEDTPEGNAAFAYALRLGPALAHSTSMAVDWAALQVQIDQTQLQAASVLIAAADNDAPDAQQDRARAVQIARDVQARYSGDNDVRNYRDPYMELLSLWRRMGANPTTAPLMRTYPSMYERPRTAGTEPATTNDAESRPEETDPMSRPPTTSVAAPTTSAAAPTTRAASVRGGRMDPASQRGVSTRRGRGRH